MDAESLDDTVVRPLRSVVSPASEAIPDLDDTILRLPVAADEVSGHARGRAADLLLDPALEPMVDTLAEQVADPVGEGIAGSLSDPVTESVSEPPGLFYRLSVGAGREPFVLDVPCLIGRDPRSPRVSRGQAPRLVAVPSPSKEVSATHLEVMQLGSTVVVTDVDSTNGSVVTVPGRAPRTLRQGESVVVTVGTVVDIGDGNLLEVLPLPHPGMVRREGESDGARH